MLRILFFVFLAFLFWLLIRVLGRSRKGGADATPDRPQAGPAPPTKSVESIMQCAWCGVHVPRGDAVTLPDGRIYCGVAHRDAALQALTPVDRTRS